MSPVNTDGGEPGTRELDPAVYTQIDYLDPSARLDPAEKAACKETLKNLSRAFAIAPMNLLYYRIAFPPRSTRLVGVAYGQYAYVDTVGGGAISSPMCCTRRHCGGILGRSISLSRCPRGWTARASLSLNPAGEIANPSNSLSSLYGSTLGAFTAYRATLVDRKAKSGESPRGHRQGRLGPFGTQPTSSSRPGRRPEEVTTAGSVRCRESNIGGGQRRRGW